MLSAVILAAGDSSRMGAPKAALITPDEGDSFIARIVRTLRASDVHDLVIVTGRHHDAVIDALTRDRVMPSPRIVRNPDPSRGQLSSLFAGMDAVVTPRTEALMMTLVDVREPFEWELGRIDGARLIPLGELPARLGELDSRQPVVAYCQRGTRSRKAAEILRAAGFADVRSLSGGIEAWGG